MIKSHMPAYGQCRAAGLPARERRASVVTFSSNIRERGSMHALLLIATLTLAQAQTGNSQAAPFTCWIRGSADKLAERASPLDSIAVQIGGGTMRLGYSRPSARGRKVMGGLVPFDQPWRLGANEATSIHVPFAAEIAGVRVEPGRTPCTRFRGHRSGRSSSTAAFSAGVFPSTTQYARGMSAPAR